MIATAFLITIGAILFGASVVGRINEAMKNKEKRESM